MRGDIFKAEMEKLSVFFNKMLNEAQLDIWYDLLKHIPDKAFQSAINYIIRGNRFFPMPEDFLTYHREFEPRKWEDVKKEYGLLDCTPEELKANRARRDKIVKQFTDSKDINQIIGDKK